MGEVEMFPAPARQDLGSVREFPVLAFELGECPRAAVLNVDIENDEPRADTGWDCDARLRPACPPREHGVGVRARVLEAMLGEWHLAAAGEDREATAGIGDRSLDEFSLTLPVWHGY
jgi:hypothetical protein